MVCLLLATNSFSICLLLDSISLIIFTWFGSLALPFKADMKSRVCISERGKIDPVGCIRPITAREFCKFKSIFIWWKRNQTSLVRQFRWIHVLVEVGSILFHFDQSTIFNDREPERISGSKDHLGEFSYFNFALQTIYYIDMFDNRIIVENHSMLCETGDIRFDL